MKRIRRLWRRALIAIKFGGSAFALIVCLAWLASGCVNVAYTKLFRVAAVGNGALTITDHHPGPRRTPPLLGWAMAVTPGWPELRAGMWYNCTTQGSTSFTVIPIWWFAIPFALVGGAAWRAEARARRRALAGHCMRCRYDRIGLPTGARCPECGFDPTGT